MIGSGRAGRGSGVLHQGLNEITVVTSLIGGVLGPAGKAARRESWNASVQANSGFWEKVSFACTDVFWLPLFPRPVRTRTLRDPRHGTAGKTKRRGPWDASVQSNLGFREKAILPARMRSGCPIFPDRSGPGPSGIIGPAWKNRKREQLGRIRPGKPWFSGKRHFCLRGCIPAVPFCPGRPGPGSFGILCPRDLDSCGISPLWDGCLAASSPAKLAP